MKILILLTAISFQSIASPAKQLDIREQKEIKILRRVIQEELKMNVGKMKKIISANNIEFEHKNNTISFEVNGYYFTVIYDANADRMRIVVPIAKVSDLTQDQIRKALEANYHTVLDARYAISNDIMWSVFIHPLSDLSEELFQSALDQTYIAAVTFGKEYISGGLSFPNTKEKKQETQSDDKKSVPPLETEL